MVRMAFQNFHQLKKDVSVVACWSTRNSATGVHLYSTVIRIPSTNFFSGYPLVMADIAIENDHLYMVDLPIDSMVIFHSFLYVYQRVTLDQWQQRPLTVFFLTWLSFRTLLHLRLCRLRLPGAVLKVGRLHCGCLSPVLQCWRMLMCFNACKFNLL